MLNIKDIRTKANYIIDSLRKRNFDSPEIVINDILKLDQEYRENHRGERAKQEAYS